MDLSTPFPLPKSIVPVISHYLMDPKTLQGALGFSTEVNTLVKLEYKTLWKIQMHLKW